MGGAKHEYSRRKGLNICKLSAQKNHLIKIKCFTPECVKLLKVFCSKGVLLLNYKLKHFFVNLLVYIGKSAQLKCYLRIIKMFKLKFETKSLKNKVFKYQFLGFF